MLSGLNGFEILKELRKQNCTSKIIMLTAKSMLEDKLEGLENGANDYLTKPFHYEELIARVRIQLSQTNLKHQDQIEYEDLILNQKTWKEIGINLDKMVIGRLSVGTHYLTNRLVNTFSIEQMDAPTGSNSNTNVEYASNATISEGQTITLGSYDSREADQNALLVTGENEVTVENVTVSKTGDSDGGDSISFYGTNSAILAKDGATLTVQASEEIVIEGKNSVTLDNVDLVDTNSKLNGKSTTYKNIFLYQSMSGEADDGTSLFSTSNRRITTNQGDTFYITNTAAVIHLENNTFVNTDSTGYFLRAQKDSWGNEGSNGGNVTLNVKNQKVVGNIAIDSISTFVMNLENNSSYEGTINGDNTASSITLSLDVTSPLKLTGDTYVTSLEKRIVPIQTSIIMVIHFMLMVLL